MPNTKRKKASSAAKKSRSTSKQTRCWSGYERVPGTKPGAKGSCRKKK